MAGWVVGQRALADRQLSARVDDLRPLPLLGHASSESLSVAGAAPPGDNPMRQMILRLSLALVICAATATSQPASVDQKLPATYIPSGRVLYQFYCAQCHGADAKGNGPMALALKTPPTDLTTLAKRHDGKFPTEYVTRMLQSGGSSRTH